MILSGFYEIYTMGRRQRLEPLSGWSMMWIICMFDIPTKTKIQMRKATRFRTQLLNHGFLMKQYSVYIKPVSSLGAAKTITKNLKNIIPDNSSVTFLYITDKQYLMTDNFFGKNYDENEEAVREKNSQILLFELLFLAFFL